MRLSGYAVALLLLIELIGLCGIFSFKCPPMEYFPYMCSLVGLWFSFGLLMGSDKR